MNVHRTMVAACACLGLVSCGEKEPETPTAPVSPTGQAAPAPSGSTSTSAAPSAMAPTGGDVASVRESVGSAAEDLQAKAKEAEAAARAAIEGYMAQLRDLTASLDGIENRVAASAKAPELRAIIERLKAGQEELMNLPTELFDSLVKEYEAQLGGLMVQVEEQVERISNNPELAGSLGELLKQIPLLGD